MKGFPPAMASASAKSAARTPTSAEPAPRTKPAPVRLDELMAAAEDLFVRQGVEATTIDQIVARAGVAKGTFYHYFSSKADVLAALRAKFSQGSWTASTRPWRPVRRTTAWRGCGPGRAPACTPISTAMPCTTSCSTTSTTRIAAPPSARRCWRRPRPCCAPASNPAAGG